LQFHYPLGALCPPLKPDIVPFQFPHKQAAKTTQE